MFYERSPENKIKTGHAEIESVSAVKYIGAAVNPIIVTEE
jgi:hypothetical protein